MIDLQDMKIQTLDFEKEKDVIVKESATLIRILGFCLGVCIFLNGFDLILLE